MMNSPDVLHSAKTGIMAAIATISSGAATFLGILPQIIGLVASLVGIVFLVVQIVYYIKKGRDERKKAALEHRLLQYKLDRIQRDDRDLEPISDR